MLLSIVIVNYNVCHFLEQCLHSVYKSAANPDLRDNNGNSLVEIFVVDNNSVDGSVAMLRQKFPDTIVIENKENVGFSRANNQAIRRAAGRYVLLLNPDTVIREDTLVSVVRFMEQHQEAGGLGVKMIDGNGHFLPESKRALPTPLVAFYKIFGLASLFPHSEVFARYYLGHLPENQVNEVEVLAGAFMLLRMSVLDKIGLLDETYFMYGEDIDLSYRITLAGYKNYYFPETAIIHYKGESTKKGSLNYVLVFYNAMIIFAKTHFSPKNARIYSLLIYLAIYFRAALSLLRRMLERILMPALDFSGIWGGFWGISQFWEQVKFDGAGQYPQEFTHYILPFYTSLFLFALFFSQAYRRPVSIYRALRGAGLGSLLVLAVYALLSEEMRFSRMVLILGSLGAMIYAVSIRWLLHKTGRPFFRLKSNKAERVIIIADEEEAIRIEKLLSETNFSGKLVGVLNLNDSDTDDSGGLIHNLDEVIRVNKVDELIFSSESLSSETIFSYMIKLKDRELTFKIAPPQSFSIIGSNSIHAPGQLFEVEHNSLSIKSNRNKKRFFDISFSVILLLLYPLIFWFYRPKRFFKNIVAVLFEEKTWVGYFNLPEQLKTLPVIPESVLKPAIYNGESNMKSDVQKRLNLLYAKDFKIKNDIIIIFKAINRLDD